MTVGGNDFGNFEDDFNRYFYYNQFSIDSCDSDARRKVGRSWSYRRSSGYLLGKEQRAFHGRYLSESYNYLRGTVHYSCSSIRYGNFLRNMAVVVTRQLFFTHGRPKEICQQRLTDARRASKKR